MPEMEPKIVEPEIRKREVIPGLSKEDKKYLEQLVYQARQAYWERVEDLADQVKSGQITVEDIIRYYAHKIGMERLSKRTMNTLESSFKTINTEKGTYTKEEVSSASEFLLTLLQRLKEIK